MITHPHVSDDALIRLAFAGTLSDGEQSHLAGCPECEDRLTRLVLLLSEVSDIAAAEADVVFPADRLDRQRTHILERLEQEARNGRVISFPVSVAHVPSRRGGPTMRWIAAAAAAGLVIGLLTGYLAHDHPAGTGRRVSRVAAEPDPATVQAVTAVSAEEEFLGRVETAIEGTSGTALGPLNELTPRVWEVAGR